VAFHRPCTCTKLQARSLIRPQRGAVAGSDEARRQREREQAALAGHAHLAHERARRARRQLHDQRGRQPRGHRAARVADLRPAPAVRDARSSWAAAAYPACRTVYAAVYGVHSVRAHACAHQEHQQSGRLGSTHCAPNIACSGLGEAEVQACTTRGACWPRRIGRRWETRQMRSGRMQDGCRPVVPWPGRGGDRWRRASRRVAARRGRSGGSILAWRPQGAWQARGARRNGRLRQADREARGRRRQVEQVGGARRARAHAHVAKVQVRRRQLESRARRRPPPYAAAQGIELG